MGYEKKEKEKEILDVEAISTCSPFADVMFILSQRCKMKLNVSLERLMQKMNSKRLRFNEMIFAFTLICTQ
jgi:hypothetical protein